MGLEEEDLVWEVRFPISPPTPEGGIEKDILRKQVIQMINYFSKQTKLTPPTGGWGVKIAI